MSDAPSEGSPEALTDFLQTRVGDHLRSVLRYDENGGEFLHLRDDVADQYSDREMDQIVQDARLEAVDKPHQEDLYAHGRLNCTVRCFDDGVEIHFPSDETSGAVVALDGEVLVTHDTFIGQCIDAMVE